MLKGGVNSHKHEHHNFVESVVEMIKEESLGREVAKKISNHSVNSCKINDKKKKFLITRIFKDIAFKILKRG